MHVLGFTLSKLQPLSKEKINLITTAIGRFIDFDMRPINIIEGKSFQALIKTLEPRYEIPSRATFSDTIIPRIYESVKNDIIAQIQYSKSCGLTFDYWSSYANKSYLTLTVHFISNEYDLQSFVLKTTEVLLRIQVSIRQMLFNQS